MKIKTNIKYLLQNGVIFSLVKNETEYLCSFMNNNVFISSQSIKDGFRTNVNSPVFGNPVDTITFVEFLNNFNINDEYDFIVADIGDKIPEDTTDNFISLYYNNKLVIYDNKLINKKQLFKLDNVDYKKLLINNPQFNNNMIIKLVEKGKINDSNIIEFVNSLPGKNKKCKCGKNEKCNGTCKTDKKKKSKKKKKEDRINAYLK